MSVKVVDVRPLAAISNGSAFVVDLFTVYVVASPEAAHDSDT
jgi:hypothetical protein